MYPRILMTWKLTDVLHLYFITFAHDFSSYTITQFLPTIAENKIISQ
jgi:hypothetical protein